MTRASNHFLKLEKRYLFSRIEEKLRAVTKKFGKENIINLGIGDICKPICPLVSQAFHQAMQEMSLPESIKGYGPALGYDFLRQAVCNKYYEHLGLGSDEIFITDGINTPITQILDIFDKDSSIAIADPAYPVYLDNAIMKGFGPRIQKLALLEENGFNPIPPKQRVDIVYLCSPGNPTGTCLSRDELTVWVDWANENNSIILFDAAYSCFIDDPSIAASIFEIPGAKNCAIEFMSFSKSAGFTGLRLGSVAISNKIECSNGQKPYHLFKTYLETVSNGISYPVQRAGLAALEHKAQKDILEAIKGYKNAALTLKSTLEENGWTVFGGAHSPYLWVKINEKTTSEAFCERLLDQGVVAIAGSGFGSFGQGYFRLSCFINKNTLKKAVKFFNKGKVHEADKERLLTL